MENQESMWYAPSGDTPQASPPVLVPPAKQKKKMPAITVAFILVALFPTVSHLLIFWLPVQGSSLLPALPEQRRGGPQPPRRGGRSAERL